MRWEPADWDRAQALIDEGKTPRAIAAILKRPIGAVQEKIRWENMSAEEKYQRNVRTRASRAKKPENVANERRAPNGHGARADGPKIPLSALAERDARYSKAPRDLTAAFFGDPLPGYSALDQRA